MKPKRGWPLVVRLARDDDRDAVMAFATNTWNDWDYVPRAWPRWLDAADGVMLVGVAGGGGGRDADGKPLSPGTVVAVVRVAMPAKGEAWLEAIRVDPRVRGMDVATDLQVAELQWASANGAHVVRYATSAANEGSHRLGARGGMEHIVSFLGVSWGPEQEERSGFDAETQQAAQRQRRAVLERLAVDGVVAGAEMSDRMWRGVSTDVSFSAGHMLYEPRPWALEELTEQKLRDHVARGEVLHRSDDGGKAVAIVVADVPPAEDATLRLALVTGIPQTAFNLVERVRRAANGASLRFRYPEGARLVNDVRQSYLDAGYELSDWAMHIMARAIDDRHPIPPVDPDALYLEDSPEAVITPPR
ncbi:MAG TPA: GNAT family N-acetyltransferase [Candidatus Limnocylindrales bacterium]